MLNLPNHTSDALEGVSTAYDALLNVTCTSSYPKLVLPTINISGFVNEVRTEIEGLSIDALDDLADKASRLRNSHGATRFERRYMRLREGWTPAGHSSVSAHAI